MQCQKAQIWAPKSNSKQTTGRLPKTVIIVIKYSALKSAGRWKIAGQLHCLRWGLLKPKQSLFNMVLFMVFVQLGPTFNSGVISATFLPWTLNFSVQNLNSPNSENNRPPDHHLLDSFFLPTPQITTQIVGQSAQSIVRLRPRLSNSNTINMVSPIHQLDHAAPPFLRENDVGVGDTI